MIFKYQRIVSFILIVGFSFPLVTEAFPQKTAAAEPRFDIGDFSKKFDVVKWLVVYDEVAWKTTDVVMTEDKAEVAKLGREWFCLQDAKNLWHAFYGKLENGKFTTVFHYTFDSAGKVSRTMDKFEQSTLDAYAAALNTSVAKLATSIPKNSPAFNQYIRKNPDGTFSVWMLPAFQTDGTAVYGGEAYYSIDAAGTKILKEEGYFQPGFRGFKTQPPREIWLSYPELEKPTLGSIFFVWYYKSYFTKIFINNSTTTSSVVNDGHNNFIWVHVEKDEKETKAP